jgi:MFS family permease
MSNELQPLYLEKLFNIDVIKIGALGSISAIFSMFSPMLSGKLVDKYDERLPLIGGFLLIFGSYVIFLTGKSYPSFVFSWAVGGIGSGMLGPPFQSLISKAVPPNLLGTFSGVFHSSMGFISLPAPWIGAQLWERVSPQTPFIVTTAAALLIIVPIYFKFRLTGKDEHIIKQTDSTPPQ